MAETIIHLKNRETIHALQVAEHIQDLRAVERTTALPVLQVEWAAIAETVRAGQVQGGTVLPLVAVAIVHAQVAETLPETHREKTTILPQVVQAEVHQETLTVALAAVLRGATHLQVQARVLPLAVRAEVRQETLIAVPAAALRAGIHPQARVLLPEVQAEFHPAEVLR
ncbi:hypothetical protein D0T56_00265 [Dysgonomonas sp. 520]|nr:hypothetical protein [Dysgonomonas sp. 520]